MLSSPATFMFATLDNAATLPSGYGLALFQAVLALVGVCLLAWALLRFAARAGLGGAPSSGKRLNVVERVALDPRRSLWVVEVDGRQFLIGSGEGAAPTLVAELATEQPDGATATVDTSKPAHDAPADVLVED